MEHHKVTCDGCGAELTSTGNCEGWRLVLAPERVPTREGVVTMSVRVPELSRPHHFCGMGCLGKWLKVRYVSIDLTTKRSEPLPFPQESQGGGR